MYLNRLDNKMDLILEHLINKTIGAQRIPLGNTFLNTFSMKNIYTLKEVEGNLKNENLKSKWYTYFSYDKSLISILFLPKLFLFILFLRKICSLQLEEQVSKMSSKEYALNYLIISKHQNVHGLVLKISFVLKILNL